MKNNLKDKVIIITGAAKGIGSVVAKHLAEMEARVCIADIDDQAAIDMARSIASIDKSAMALKCDITSTENVSKMVEKVIERFGKIDILINNAGFFPIKMFGDITIEEWKRVIDINLTGTFNVTQAVYNEMKKQGSGKIINVASVAGRVGGIGFVHYSAAKSGVIGLTRALAKEAAQVGIQVNAIAPGLIETNTAKSVFPEYALKEFKRNVPMRRLGKEEDIVGIIEFLCSEGSNYITGQVFAIDGGYTMI